eukprot:592300-Prymnesium_polylepis.1
MGQSGKHRHCGRRADGSHGKSDGYSDCTHAAAWRGLTPSNGLPCTASTRTNYLMPPPALQHA